MSAFTCKVHQLTNAPKRITLLGDKNRPESAQHVIEFPGGAIEVSRTTTGEYWAHIHINRDWKDSDMEGVHGAMGEVVGSRIATPDGIKPIPEQAGVSQIAVLIRTTR